MAFVHGRRCFVTTTCLISTPLQMSDSGHPIIHPRYSPCAKGKNLASTCVSSPQLNNQNLNMPVREFKERCAFKYFVLLIIAIQTSVLFINVYAKLLSNYSATTLPSHVCPGVFSPYLSKELSTRHQHQIQFYPKESTKTRPTVNH